MADLLLWLVTGLPVAAAAVLLPPVRPEPVELDPSEIGFLRGGTKGAVLTALAALHADGLVKAGAQGGVRRAAQATLRSDDPFQRAVYSALHSAIGPRELALRPAIRRARDAMARRLAGAGLMPGRARLVFGRTTLAAVPAVAVLQLATGGTITGLVVPVLIAAGLWPLSRRTLAGHRVSWQAHQEHTRLLGSWRPGEAPAWGGGVGKVDSIAGVHWTDHGSPHGNP